MPSAAMGLEPWGLETSGLKPWSETWVKSVERHWGTKWVADWTLERNATPVIAIVKGHVTIGGRMISLRENMGEGAYP